MFNQQNTVIQRLCDLLCLTVGLSFNLRVNIPGQLSSSSEDQDVVLSGCGAFDLCYVM